MPRTSQPHRSGQPDDGRQQAAGKSRQAKAALDSGDFEQALALLDEAELLYPDHGISYGAARDQVRSAMDQTGPGHPQDQDSPATALAAARPGTGDAATAGTATDTAAPDSPGTAAARPGTAASPQPPDAADAGALGEADAGQQKPGAGTGRPAQQTASPAPGQHAPDDTEAAPTAPGGHYDIRMAGHPRGHQVMASHRRRENQRRAARTLAERPHRPRLGSPPRPRRPGRGTRRRLPLPPRLSATGRHRQRDGSHSRRSRSHRRARCHGARRRAR